MSIQGYIDIHCHILPGIDDGASTLSDALEMAAMACANGTRTIVATPHASHEYPPLPASELMQRIADLQAEIDGKPLPLRILPGADIHISPALPTQVRQRDVLTVGDTGRYLLLELPHDIYVPFDDLIDELKATNTRVILTHPERNRGIRADIEVLWHLIRQGCLIQVTAGSILGEFGRDIQAVTRDFLKQRLVHFVASDAHSPQWRKPLLHEAFKAVSALTDPAYADKLFREFPARAIEGAPITAPDPRPVPRSLFRRLFGYSQPHPVARTA